MNPDMAAIEFLRSVGVEIPPNCENMIEQLFDNLDIVQKFPPAVMWGFNCQGGARPMLPFSGSLQAMFDLEHEGRILELHAYRYIIWLLRRQPQKKAA